MLHLIGLALGSGWLLALFMGRDLVKGAVEFKTTVSKPLTVADKARIESLPCVVALRAKQAAARKGQ